MLIDSRRDTISFKWSWIGRAGKVPDAILKRLGNSNTFQQYVGLSLLALSPDTIDPKDITNMWNFVSSGYAASDAMLNSNIWKNYQQGLQVRHPSITIKEQENFLTAELKLRTLLQTELLNRRGLGLSIESLAARLMRTGELTQDEEVGIRFRTDVEPQNMTVYIRSANGEEYSPPRNLQSEAWNWWTSRDWSEKLRERRKFDNADENELYLDIVKYHRQPYSDAEGKPCIRTETGVVYKPYKEQKLDASGWGYNDWVNQLRSYLTKSQEVDEAFIEQEIKEGRQPLVKVNKLNFDIDENTPWAAIPYWGVWLQTLSKEEILALANGRFCDPTCQTYHGSVKGLKELGELIAPVDTAMFAKELLESYTLWREKATSRDTFKVLIPAQADETTIIGIIDHLLAAGISREELKQNFRLVLADLCPTPLLSIYANLRDQGLLDITNIVSMDVFNWVDPLEEKFDFVATDHFIDLFPEKGKFNQTRILLTLISALAPGGKLVLTARSGTHGRVLDHKNVMDEFYTRCQQAINHLTEELELADSTPGDQYPGLHSSVFPTKQDLARGIYALLAYLTLRDVHPFANVATLNSLMTKVQKHLKNNFTFSLSPLEGKRDKIYISATKRKDIPPIAQIFPERP